jgi:hypothetical protein
MQSMFKTPWRKNMKRTLIATLLFINLCLASTVNAAFIDTDWTADNGGRGAMFDIKAFDQGLTINALDLKIPNFVANNTYSIYTKAGTYLGFETEQTAWSLLGTLTDVTGAGLVGHVYVDIPDFAVNANTTVGVYISGNASGRNDRLVYADAAQSFFNDDIRIEGGVGFEQEDEFENPLADPKTWSGTVYYNFVPIPGSVWLLISGLVALVGVRRFSLKN